MPSLNWGTQLDWENATKTDVEVVNDTFQLASSIVDDFEDSGLSEYTEDTHLASVTSSPVYNGSGALALTSPSGGGWTTIISTTGLPAYPASGSTYRVWSRRTDNNGRERVLFGVQDTDSFYCIIVDHPSTTTELQVHDNGSVTTLDSVNQTPPTNGTWGYRDIEWLNDGTLNVDMNGSFTLSGQDSTFAAGGIGFAHQLASQSTGQWFDYGHLR